MKNIQKIALLIACCLTTITPNLGFADESNTKLLFEQTCYQLVKEDWLSEDFTIMEYSENKQFDAKYEARGDNVYFNLVVNENNEPERFAFQLKPDEPLENQINTIFHALFFDMEDQSEFVDSLVESYTASMTLNKQNPQNPYAQKWYNQQRYELDTGWLYIWQQ